MFNEQSHQQDQQDHNQAKNNQSQVAASFSALQKEIEGLQHLSRRFADELYQANVQLGQARQELEYTKADVKKLSLQMEQVATHIRSK